MGKFLIIGGVAGIFLSYFLLSDGKPFKAFFATLSISVITALVGFFV